MSFSRPTEGAEPEARKTQAHNAFLGGITLGWLLLAAAAGVLGLVLVSSSAITNRSLLTATALAGAAGSCLTGGVAVSSFVGNRSFRKSWTAYFALRPLLGAALAVLIYFIIRAVIVSSNSPASSLNHYGILAIAFFAGIFSKNLLDKILEISDIILTRGSGLATQLEQRRNPPPQSVHDFDPYRGFIVYQVTVIERSNGESWLLRMRLQSSEPTEVGSHEVSLELSLGEGPQKAETVFRFTVFQHNSRSVTPPSNTIIVAESQARSNEITFAFDPGESPDESIQALIEVSQHGRTVAVVNTRDSHSR